MKKRGMRQVSAVIAAFAAAALVIPGGTAFADTEEEKIYRLRNAESGEYLTVDGEMAQKEGNLITKEANGTLKQEFAMSGEDCVMLISQSNQRDLAVNVWGSRTEEGCNINLWEQTGEGTQMWIPVPVKGGYVLQSADNEAYVMGTYHGNVQAEVYCRGDEDQIWELIETKESGTEAVTELLIRAENSIVSRNDTMELELICEPEDGNLRLLAWESSNPDVLSVNQDGMVTAKDNGMAVISAVLPDGIRADLALEVRDIEPEETEPEETEPADKDDKQEDGEKHFVCSTPEEWKFLEMLGGEEYLIREDGEGNTWIPTEILDVQEYDESYEMVLHLGYLKENGEQETFELIDYGKYTTVLSDTENWYEAVKDEGGGGQAPELVVDYEQLETGIWIFAKAADGSRYQYRISAADFEEYRNGFQGEREVYYGWMQDGMISGLFQAEPIVVSEEMDVPETSAEEVIENQETE